MDYTLKCLKTFSKILRTKYRKICLRYHYKERFSKASIKSINIEVKNKFNYIYKIILCRTKNSIYQAPKQAAAWEKIFGIHVMDEKLMSHV